MQPLGTKKSHNLSAQKNNATSRHQKNHATSWHKKHRTTSHNKKIRQPLDAKKNHANSWHKRNHSTSWHRRKSHNLLAQKESMLKGRDQLFFGITWVQIFQIELKPVRGITADANLKRCQDTIHHPFYSVQ